MELLDFFDRVIWYLTRVGLSLGGVGLITTGIVAMFVSISPSIQNVAKIAFFCCLGGIAVIVGAVLFIETIVWLFTGFVDPPEVPDLEIPPTPTQPDASDS